MAKPGITCGAITRNTGKLRFDVLPTDTGSVALMTPSLHNSKPMRRLFGAFVDVARE